MKRLWRWLRNLGKKKAILMGSNTTEATTNSTTLVDLLPLSSLGTTGLHIDTEMPHEEEQEHQESVKRMECGDVAA